MRTLIIGSILLLLVCLPTWSYAQSETSPPTAVIEESNPSSEGATSAPSAQPTATETAPSTSAEQPTPKKEQRKAQAQRRSRVSQKKVSTRRRTSSHAKARPVPTEPVDVRLPITRDSWAYAEASSHSRRIKRIHAGRYVHVTGLTPYFLRVELRDGETAYVDPDVVKMVVPADKILTLISDSPVRERPNQWAKELAEVHKGHHVQVVGVAPNYVRIRMRSGLEGYIPYSALEGGASSLPPNEITSGSY